MEKIVEKSREHQGQRWQSVHPLRSGILQVAEVVVDVEMRIIQKESPPLIEPSIYSRCQYTNEQWTFVSM